MLFLSFLSNITGEMAIPFWAFIDTFFWMFVSIFHLEPESKGIKIKQLKQPICIWCKESTYSSRTCKQTCWEDRFNLILSGSEKTHRPLTSRSPFNFKQKKKLTLETTKHNQYVAIYVIAQFSSSQDEKPFLFTSLEVCPWVLSAA